MNRRHPCPPVTQPFLLQGFLADLLSSHWPLSTCFQHHFVGGGGVHNPSICQDPRPRPMMCWSWLIPTCKSLVKFSRILQACYSPFGSLKWAKIGMFTPWKSAGSTSQSFYLRELVVNHLTIYDSLYLFSGPAKYFAGSSAK